MKNKKLLLTLPLAILTIFGVGLLVGCEKEKDPKKYEVVFRSNGGTTYYNVVGYAGDTITLPTPEKEGYTFAGWYTDSKFETEALSDTYTIDIGRTLYAKWNPYEGTIIFESNGGTKYENLIFSAQKVEIPVPEKDGFIFGGWYATSTFEGEEVKGTILPTDDMKLYAKWNAITGSITFESNGGTEYEKAVTAGQKVKIPTPVKEQSIFAGWYDNKDFKGRAIEGEYLPEGDITLYARWATKYQLVTLEENGGNSLEDIKLFDDDTFELPTPYRYGYRFEGWYDNSTFQGEPVSDYFYRPLEDITLYAKWEKCTYLYLFYGETLTYERFEYLEGDVISIDELYSLFTPEDLVGTDYLGNECYAPFMYWEHQGYDASTNYEVVDDILVGEEFIILSAKYDMSDFPPKEYLSYDKETKIWKTTGKTAHVFMDAPSNIPYVYSIDMSFRKGISGAVGPAFRMDVSKIDYYYETGCSYLSAGIIPESGGLQVSQVVNGSWSRLASNIAISNLPKEWQTKFNNAEINETVSVTMSIIDYGTYFEVYIDSGLAFVYSNAENLSNFASNKLGIRSSSTPAEILNPRAHNGCTISFETGDSNFVDEPIKWYCGAIDLPHYEKENSVVEGWYYDSAFTSRVDYENISITEDTTLYAKWSDQYHTISFDSKGGSNSNSMKWAAGKIKLPKPTKMNGIFTGWYYDSECTQLVDENNLSISGNTTLYAGWRLPLHKFTVVNGTYIHTATSIAVVGLVDNPIPINGTYNEYSMDVVYKKGSASAGLAFRMDVGNDYSYEDGCQYLSVQFAGSTLRISKTEKNGDWSRLVSDVSLTKLSQSYQDKYNSAAEASMLTTTLAVRDYGNHFEVYLDGELAYTYENTNSVDISNYLGNGYGIRSSAADSSYKKITVKTVTIE